MALAVDTDMIHTREPRWHGTDCRDMIRPIAGPRTELNKIVREATMHNGVTACSIWVIYVECRQWQDSIKHGCREETECGWGEDGQDG